MRVAGDRAFITIKGLTLGTTRAEFEYEIPPGHAEDLLKLCDGPLIEKFRYQVTCDGLVWEVDEFLGANRGLILAEVELHRVDQSFMRPAWLGEEVTHDPRYFNSNLCVHPYDQWDKDKD